MGVTNPGILMAPPEVCDVRVLHCVYSVGKVLNLLMKFVTWRSMTHAKGSILAEYNFKALSCTPTYLHPPISQFLHHKLLENLKFLDSNLLVIFADKHVYRKLIC